MGEHEWVESAYIAPATLESHGTPAITSMVRIFAFDVQRLRLYNRLTLSVKEEMRRTEEFWDLYNNRQLDSTVNTREPPTIPQLSLALLCCKPISGTAQRCMYDILGCDSLSSPDLLTGVRNQTRAREDPNLVSSWPNRIQIPCWGNHNHVSEELSRRNNK